MRLDEDKSKEIRCFCHRRPLLARIVINETTGKPVIWVKTVKNGHVITEVVISIGSTHVRCRECERFHRIDLWQDVVKGYTVSPEDAPKLSVTN